MPIEGVVADANVLLSAVAGKAALRVITAFDVIVHVAQFNADEVAEYLPLMAQADANFRKRVSSIRGSCQQRFDPCLTSHRVDPQRSGVQWRQLYETAAQSPHDANFFQHRHQRRRQ